MTLLSVLGLIGNLGAIGAASAPPAPSAIVTPMTMTDMAQRAIVMEVVRKQILDGLRPEARFYAYRMSDTSLAMTFVGVRHVGAYSVANADGDLQQMGCLPFAETNGGQFSAAFRDYAVGIYDCTARYRAVAAVAVNVSSPGTPPSVSWFQL